MWKVWLFLNYYISKIAEQPIRYMISNKRSNSSVYLFNAQSWVLLAVKLNYITEYSKFDCSGINKWIECFCWLLSEHHMWKCHLKILRIKKNPFRYLDSRSTFCHSVYSYNYHRSDFSALFLSISLSSILSFFIATMLFPVSNVTISVSHTKSVNKLPYSYIVCR